MTESVEQDTDDKFKEKEKLPEEDKNEKKVVEHEDEDNIKLKNGKNVPIEEKDDNRGTEDRN